MQQSTSAQPPPTGWREARRTHARRRRRALLAAALVPCAGSCLVRTGRVGSWRVLALAASGLVAALVAAAHAPLHRLASWSVLSGIAVVNVVVLGLRLVDLGLTVAHVERTDPRRVPRRRRSHRRLSRATRRLAVVAAGAMVLVHGVVVVQLQAARDTLAEAFPLASHPRPGLPAQAPTRSPGAVPSPRDDLVDPDGLLDVLLIGLDAGAGRRGARNDANLVVRVDPTTADTLLVGVPRNLVRLPLPATQDECACFRSPLYALYGHGHANAEQWPGELDPGAAAVRDSLEALLGVTIDRYVVADMGAFVDLVDAIGGVSLTFASTIVDEKSDPFEAGSRIRVTAGPGAQRLDGREALALARSRRGTDDYVRMRRQRCLVGALAAPASRLALADVLRLTRSVRGRLTSDIARDELPVLVELLRRVRGDAIDSLGLAPPVFGAGYERGYPLADRTAIEQAVRAWPHEDRPRSVAEPCA